MADLLQSEGYETVMTPITNDYCVDIFATRDRAKLAVQCKMYGGSERRINRSTILELHGAAAYFDCSGSIIATNGELMPDARSVAEKLGVRILLTHAAPTRRSGRIPGSASLEFGSIWERHVMPLVGQTLTRPDGKTNVLVSADWSGVRRVTSTGGRQFIKIEIFEWAVNRLLSRGWVTRPEINQEYVGRASRGVVLILSQVPLFRLVGNERLEVREQQ